MSLCCLKERAFIFMPRLKDLDTSGCGPDGDVCETEDADSNGFGTISPCQKHYEEIIFDKAMEDFAAHTTPGGTWIGAEDD